MCCSLNCVINMEEFRKYKDILAREYKEFRAQMEREVSAFFAFSNRQREAVFELGIIELCDKFCKYYLL